MNRPISEALIRRAEESIPGGVNSPVRAFKGVGGSPVFFTAGAGAELTDADGRSYIDYVGSWGPMILGHSHPEVIAAVDRQVHQALGFGAPTEAEIELAELVCQRIPSIDKVRLVSSGTEATMSAIRLARGFTGRERIVKFEGCYHGHADSLLVKAGSGVLTLGLPNSPGVPAALAELTMTLPYNDSAAVTDAFAQAGDEIACVIVEPIAGNMGCIPPEPGFLETLREVTRKHGAILIFDEVMTGFRVSASGAQGLYGVDPDLTTLGKVIGGGLPVGAFGGREDIMNHVAPVGSVYQAGTLSGNPVAVTAGLATLTRLDETFYTELAAKTRFLCDGLRERARARNVTVHLNEVCGMFGMFFAEGPVRNFEDVSGSDIERFNRFFHLMLDAGMLPRPVGLRSRFCFRRPQRGPAAAYAGRS